MQWLTGPWEQNSLWMNVAVFSVAALFIWRAGTRLSRNADAIAQKTRLGQAFIGALLLGGTTSLPEAVTTVTASVGGNADIAVNNIVGGIAMQVVVLALADVVIGGGALSGSARHPDALLQGALVVLVLTIALAGMIVGSISLFGIGLWTIALFICVIAGLYLIETYEKKREWKPVEQHRRTGTEKKRDNERRELSLRRLLTEVAVAGIVILVAGFVLTRSGEGIADQTGMGATFAGAVLIAIATSLPEVSTTFEAARMGRNLLAFSGIFGTNLFDAGLLLLADIAYAGEPVLSVVSAPAQFTVVLAIACTTVYLVGLVERSEIQIGRAGLDSVIIVLTYLGGVFILYRMGG